MCVCGVPQWQAATGCACAAQPGPPAPARASNCRPVVCAPASPPPPAPRHALDAQGHLAGPRAHLHAPPPAAAGAEVQPARDAERGWAVQRQCVCVSVSSTLVQPVVHAGARQTGGPSSCCPPLPCRHRLPALPLPAPSPPPLQTRSSWRRSQPPTATFTTCARWTPMCTTGGRLEWS